MPDPTPEAREIIRGQEKRIKDHADREHLKSEVNHLVSELDALPQDATVVVSVRSPATSKDRQFVLPRDAGVNLGTFANAEKQRLEVEE